VINLQLAFFSDEKWFHFQEYINTQNNHHWISQNPYLTHEVPLHPVNVGAWCAVRARRIIGHAYFNEITNCKGYVRVILRQFWAKFPKATPKQKNQRKIFIGKLQIFMQNSFKR
jgi:hypothetical protein